MYFYYKIMNKIKYKMFNEDINFCFIFCFTHTILLILQNKMKQHPQNN